MKAQPTGPCLAVQRIVHKLGIWLQSAQLLDHLPDCISIQRIQLQCEASDGSALVLTTFSSTVLPVY